MKRSKLYTFGADKTCRFRFVWKCDSCKNKENTSTCQESAARGGRNGFAALLVQHLPVHLQNQEEDFNTNLPKVEGSGPCYGRFCGLGKRRLNRRRLSGVCA
uniref:(northern house mosquito) hypothetical protein n=1 Tax=Culex pipiens TaxID=7175 RepID=A0A8D8IQI9_CULPI